MLKNAERVEAIRHALPGAIQQPLKKLIKGYRLLTSGLRLLPDYIIFGARRCGTTSLYKYLIQHPSILPALTKETGYFDQWYAKGKSWYRGHFPLRMHKRLCEKTRGGPVITGEASPSYFFDPLVPARIRALVPDVKLIALLRNPVDTIHSAYHLGLKHRTYSSTNVVFENCIKAELDEVNGASGSYQNGASKRTEPVRPFLPQGIYVDALKLWFEMFPRTQIRVLIYEDFFRDPQLGYNQVLSFLGVARHELSAFKVFNNADYTRMDPELRKRLVNFFAPHNQRLRDLLGTSIDWDI